VHVTLTDQARQVIRRCPHILIVEASPEANQVLIDVMPATLGELLELADQVGVVLISERRDETVGIAVGIRAMARGALLMKDASAERHVRTIARLCMPRDGDVVEIGGDVDPGLRFPQFLLHQHVAHARAIALCTRKIRQLAHDIVEPLPGKGRYRLGGIALRSRSMTACAVLPKLQGAALRMRIELERGLGRTIHRFLGCRRAEARQGADDENDSPKDSAEPVHYQYDPRYALQRVYRQSIAREGTRGRPGGRPRS